MDLISSLMSSSKTLLTDSSVFALLLKTCHPLLLGSCLPWLFGVLRLLLVWVVSACGCCRPLELLELAGLCSSLLLPSLSVHCCPLSWLRFLLQHINSSSLALHSLTCGLASSSNQQNMDQHSQRPQRMGLHSDRVRATEVKDEDTANTRSKRK